MDYDCLTREVSKYLEDIDKVALSVTCKDIHTRMHDIIYKIPQIEKIVCNIVKMINHVKQYPCNKIRYIFSLRWNCLEQQGCLFIIEKNSNKCKSVTQGRLAIHENVHVNALFKSDAAGIEWFRQYFTEDQNDIVFLARHQYKKKKITFIPL